MDSHTNGGGILNIVHPGYPWFRFEFMGGKVHCIRVPRPGYSGAATAEVIAEHVYDPQEAKMAVGAFIVGYQMHADEPVEFRGNGPRNYRLFCEGFGMGMRLGGR